MNEIRPFHGLRYDERVVGLLGDVLCPPYDVISPVEQLDLHGRSPYNAVRVELGLEFPEDDLASNRYTRAAETLDRWVAAGALRRDEQSAVYLYEQRFQHDGRTLSRPGLLALLRLSGWHEGVVLPHEETMSGPKEDRLRLMRATSANISPLYLLFEDPSRRARSLMETLASEEPDASAVTPDGQTHLLWAVSGERGSRLVEALASIQLYMADGHHRYETALAYRDERRAAGKRDGEGAGYNFAMVLLVDAEDPGLVVLPTHRLVRAADPWRLSRLEESLAERFEFEPVAAGGDADSVARVLTSRMEEAGAAGPAIGMYRIGSAVVLRPRVTSHLAPGGGRPLLDVDVLHAGLLEPLLGIGPAELKAGLAASYTRDAAEAVAEVDRSAAQVAFLLNPTRVEQVLETARAVGKMPQKSTYFYPKPPTGLVINRFGGMT